jgi:NAD-dependent dihydropyrimidine dehydrogenase PreA subunit
MAHPPAGADPEFWDRKQHRFKHRFRRRKMEDFRYLPGVTSLVYDKDSCFGCGTCAIICPHGVFAMNGKKTHLVDKDGCMECGACA